MRERDRNRKWASPDTCRLWQLQSGCAHRAPFSTLLHLQWVGQRRVHAHSTWKLAEQAAAPQCWGCVCHQHPKRRQTAPEPLPPSSSTAAPEEGAKGLRLSEEGSVCVCLRFSTHLSHSASCFGAVPARGPGQQHISF